MKFRKKPVVVEVEQFLGKPVKGLCPYNHDDSIPMPHVLTIHDNQFVLIEVGDWIMTKPDGEHFYPCKPDIFEQTYEKEVLCEGKF